MCYATDVSACIKDFLKMDKNPNDLTEYFLLKPKEKTHGAEEILTGFQDHTHRQVCRWTSFIKNSFSGNKVQLLWLRCVSYALFCDVFRKDSIMFTAPTKTL